MTGVQTGLIGLKSPEGKNTPLQKRRDTVRSLTLPLLPSPTKYVLRPHGCLYRMTVTLQVLELQGQATLPSRGTLLYSAGFHGLLK